MPSDLFDSVKVIDVDTHITEPPNVFVDRVPQRYRDDAPHIERVDGEDIWVSHGERIGKPGSASMAGFDGVVPASPATYDEIPTAMYDSTERLRHMDGEGIYAEVLYPNVGGFGSAAYLRLGGEDLATECVRAYNDFMIEWCSADPKRLIPVMTLPFWDVDAAVAEIERGVGLGYRSVNFCNQPDHHGQPALSDSQWDPIWATAQDAGLPISFHIGGCDIGRVLMNPGGMGFQANFARVSSMLFMDNMRCIADLVFAGICHRYPTLRFVSVESGVGWLPGALEAFDWQWRNGGINVEHPEYDLLPSEYFRRQIYGCFWFEEASALFAIERFPDNILYETDYPHPTCQHPGPLTPAEHPRVYAQRTLGRLDDITARKILHDNAAALYSID